MTPERAQELERLGEVLAQEYDDWYELLAIIMGALQECNMHSLAAIIEAVDPIETNYEQRKAMLQAIKTIRGIE